jgi:NADH-quinone oxidoreductase subunit E
MLSDEQRREVLDELEHYPTKQAACIEALKIVQKHDRWVSDEAIQELADLIGMPAAELDSVATFFNLIYRRPVGRHVILLCDSVSCWLMGCNKIRAQLVDRLGIDYGQTTKDNRFTLLPMACLGTCDRAPAMMIDEQLHRDLTAESLDKILKATE